VFKITPTAAEQIRQSIQASQAEGMALRLVARRKADASIEYLMGFDEIHDEDLHLTTENVDIVIGPEYKALLNGAEMDYVELEPGKFSFIFKNPNDPSYVPPKAE
jgi:iron-sulfur cluster assembly protein